MKRGLLYLLVLATLASCAKDAAVDEPRVDGAEEKIYASIDATEDGEDSESDTRVELNNKKQTVWTAGDQFMTFSNDGFKLWQFDGKTGDRSGSFIHAGNYGTPEPGYVDYDQHYAVYLADLTYGAYSDKSPKFYTTLPSTITHNMKTTN